MAKRKGKTPTIGSGGKRLRENGRLKLQRSDSIDEDLQEKILKDAGFDPDTMKSVSDAERQAIIKAIMDSNRTEEVVLVDSSESDGDGRDSPMAQLSCNELETQPPNGDLEVAGRDSPETLGSGSSPLELAEMDIPPESRLEEDRILPQDLVEGGSNVSSESDEMKRTMSIEEEQNEGGDNESNCSALSDEDTQPFQKKDELPSVLAVETQFFSPEHKMKRKADTLDVIPESPQHASPIITEGEEKEREEGEREAGCALLNRTYPARPTSTSITCVFQDFLPRLSPGTVTNRPLYTNVIKSMFDIYLRRLRLANAQIKENPIKWGNPVKTGLHCENLLRRKTLASEGTDKKDGKKNGRDRRRILKRNVRNDSDTLSDGGDEKQKINQSSCSKKRPTTPSDTEDIPSDVPKTKCDTENVYEIDNFSSSDDDSRNVSKSKLNTRSRTKNKDKDVAFASTSKYSDSLGNENRLSPHQQPKNSPSPLVNDEYEMQVPPLEIEILDDDPISDSKSSLGSWLSAKRLKEKSSVLETKGNKKNKTRSDSPQVSKGILKRKGKRKDIGQTTISEVFIVDNDLSQIIENGDELNVCNKKSNPEEDTNQKNDKEMKQKNQERLRTLSLKKDNNLKVDLPSSIDSTDFLNSQGDMYSTQMTKMEFSEKKKAGKRDSALQLTVDSSMANMVTISSGPRKKTQKGSSSVEGIEIVEIGDTLQFEKADVSGNQTVSTGAVSSESVVRASRSRRKRKSSPDEDSEISESFGNDSNVVERNCARASNRKRALVSKDQQHIVNTSSIKSKKHVIDVDEVEDESSTGKRGASLTNVSDTEKNSATEIKGKKKKRRLFDESTYEFGEESSVDDCNFVINAEKQVTNKPFVCGDTESIGEQVDNSTLLQGQASSSTSSNKEDETETNVEEGTCPICNKMFTLDKLEAHAATCGEGTTEDEVSSTVECMICHKEIDREVLKKHQKKCAATRALEENEEVVAKRITRAKHSSSSKRKKALEEEKSPSSSGEEYGELVIELGKGKH